MSLFKSASIVSMFTLLSRITGVIREQLMASIFGASAMTDAFNVAFRLPNMFRRLFAEGAFSQAFIPILGASRVQDGEQATQNLINQVATILFYTLVLTCILGIVFAPYMVWVMASGLKQNMQGYHAAVQMARLMFPYIGFMSLVALGAGILNTYKRFAVAAATPVLLNIAMILAAWLGAPWFEKRGIEPIYALCAGVMLGGAMQLAIQWFALSRLGLRPRIALRPAQIRRAWQYPKTQRVLQLMLPSLLGVGVAHLSAIINLQIASHLTQGSVSWMSYAERLMEFPSAMLGVALGVVLTPRLVSAKAQGDKQSYSQMLDWGLRLVVTLALPSTLALLLFAQPMVAVLYHYGKFTAFDVTQSSNALMSYGVGLVGLIAIKVLAPGYYASQDIKTPVKIAIMVLILTQIFNLVLVRHLAHAGLALSISLGALVNATWLLVGLIRKGNYQPQAGWKKLSFQILPANVVLAAGFWWSSTHIPWLQLQNAPFTRVLYLTLILGALGSLYFIVLRIFGLNVIQLMRK